MARQAREAPADAAQAIERDAPLPLFTSASVHRRHTKLTARIS